MDSANKIIVRDDARDLGITNPVGCLISGLDVQSEAPELDEDVTAIEQLAADSPAEVLESAAVNGSREIYDRMGYSGVAPDGELRFNLISRRGLNRHNNVVDAYNIAGAEYGLGLGMHDAARLRGEITVRRAAGGERIVPLFRESERVAKRGDLMYRTDRYPLWVSGEIRRDADRFRVTESTDQALLMVVGNHNTSTEHNRAVCERTYELIAKTCPDATIEFLDTVAKPKTPPRQQSVADD